MWKSSLKKNKKCKLSILRTFTVKITQELAIKHEWGAFTDIAANTKGKLFVLQPTNAQLILKPYISQQHLFV